jgi:predicted secreted Zn-dependent protease
LIHERLHFDIAELYARKIRKKIQELSARNITDIKIYNTMIRELLEESNTIDRQYDIETLHGALLKKQKQWEVKIKDELRVLESFKKSRQVISSER